MFSTSTTASSTSSPMAMARPPRVIVLIDSPSHLKTRIAVRMDKGMAVSEISMVRKLPRKKNSTPATKNEAISSFICRLPSEASMKSAWRKKTCGALMPAGRLPFMSASAASRRRVRSTVSAVGCFWMLRMTAGLATSPSSKPPSPRLIAAEKPTSATWRSRMGCPARAVSATFFRSSSRALRPRWRIRYSRPLSSRKPPEVLAAKPRTALSICSRPMPSSAIRRVSGRTWNWRTSPPIGMTCDTPAIAIRRGRSTQSAYSRAALGSAPSPRIGMATSMISPMIDDTGPMRGTAPGGRVASSAVSRSLTICRAR